MLNAPTIRPAKPDDVVAIKCCVAAAYRVYLERMAKPPGPMLEDYSVVIRRHRVFVCEHGKELIGVLVMIERDGEILLDNVAVSPALQGQGVGSRLIAFAETQARSLGYLAMELYTHELMVENLAMYQAKGFVEIARRVEHGYQRVYLRKVL